MSAMSDLLDALKRLEAERESMLTQQRETVPALPTAPLLLTVAQASEYIGMSKNEVYKLIYKGQLTSIKLGRKFRRIPRKACEEWVEKQAREGF